MEKVLQSYLLLGRGDQTLARAGELAMAALCESSGPRPCRACRQCRKVAAGIHPDVTYVEPLTDSSGKQKQNISVDQIRNLATDARVLPNDAEQKVYILPSADRMNENAQNAFLKLLEEPPAFVHFILCAEDSRKLLPTILSRCASERLGGEEQEASEELARAAKAFLDVRNKPLDLYEYTLRFDKYDARQLTALLDCIRQTAFTVVEDQRELIRLEEYLAKAQKYLSSNVSVKTTGGYLAAWTYEK